MPQICMQPFIHVVISFYYWWQEGLQIVYNIDKVLACCNMKASSNGNIFRVTGPLLGEFIGYRWIPLTKGSDTELWCFLWSAPDQMVKQTSEVPVISDAIALIMASL